MFDNFLSKERLRYYQHIYFILMLGLYWAVYFFEPFGEFTNLFLLNSIIVLSALVCALILTSIVRFFAPGEPPRRVWFPFAVALWMWAMAELAWAVYNMLWGEVPAFSFADILWAVAYIFFTISLANQFDLLQFKQNRWPTWVSLGVWVVVILLSALVTFWSNGAPADMLLSFYPIADFALGVAALFLVINFRRGSLARPWLGLFGFVVSDALYLWATSTGIYDWGGRVGWITFTIDIIYLFAYLFVSWGVFSQYLMLRFGAAPPGASQTTPARPKSLP